MSKSAVQAVQAVQTAVLLAVALLASCGTVAVGVELEVDTSLGRVRGMVQHGVRQWRSIPFAAAPVGELRFAAPQPAKAWSSVRDATGGFPASCPQAAGLFGKMSEDCLYLNVFSPLNATSASSLAVMVWVYGGSFRTGGTSLFLYNADKLVSSSGDVVVVTVNYRLGALGFLASDELPTANAGLLDQNAALQWVARNAKAFGGDPQRVTLFGESAGSMSACFHTVMPASRGLFQRAILESGACLQGADGPLYYAKYGFDVARNTSDVLAKRVGCEDSNDLVCLRAASYEEIVDAQNLNKMLSWAPAVDGVTVPIDPLVAYRTGKAADVDIIVGVNTNEGTMFAGSQSLSASQYEAIMKRSFPSVSQAVLDLYPASNFSSPFYAYAAVVTDYFFYAPARRLLDLRTGSARAYLYHWKHAPSWWTCPGRYCHDVPLKVAHTSELYSVFGHPPPVNNITFTPEEATLSLQTMSAWASFASTGVPSFGALSSVQWPTYNTSTKSLLELDVGALSPSAQYKSNLCDFWDSVTP